MSIGQEGDTRQYRRLRKSDYYESKAAVEGLKLDPKYIPRCSACKQEITGHVWGSEKEPLCMRCAT